MLLMLRNTTKLTMYKDLEGAFNCNRTPMAPLGNKGVVYITPNMRNTFASHRDKVYTVSRAPNHRQLLNWSVPVTRGNNIFGTYHLDPSRWKLPAVGKQDKTIISSANLLAAFQRCIPTTAADKQKHIAATRKPAAILCNNHQQREPITTPPRVDNAKP